MRVLEYVPNSIVDGVGIRQVFYLAGCPHHCKDCHNPESWDYNGGTEWENTKVALTALESPYNVTFSGGDPFYQPYSLMQVCGLLSPYNKHIWVYTGYTWEQLVDNDIYEHALWNIEVLVDGKFDVTKRNPELQFRGSSNQRIIDVQRSLKEGYVVLWKDGDYV